MKIKVVIENKSKMQLFSFVVSENHIGLFVQDIISEFDNIEDMNMSFSKIKESEE